MKLHYWNGVVALMVLIALVFQVMVEKTPKVWNGIGILFVAMNIGVFVYGQRKGY